MADADETQTEQTQDAETTQTETTETPSTQTFTQADVDRIVAERVSREQRKQKDEAKKAADKAKMDAEQLAKAEKEEAEKERDEARENAKRAGYRADLKGEVVDVTAALRLIDADKHVKNDAVDVKALLKDYPFLNPVKQPSAPGGGGEQPQDNTDPLSSLAAAQEADRKAGR